MIRPSKELVLRKLHQLFAGDGPLDTAADLLETYGIEAYEPERERVQLAVLKLCAGDLGRLAYYVKIAKLDYRDVLAWAEYPEQIRSGATNPDSTPEMLSAIRKRDRRQYLQWLSE